MEKQSTIYQLVGEYNDIDYIDDMEVVVYGPSKYPEADTACVSFDRGVVELFAENASNPYKTYKIKASLEE